MPFQSREMRSTISGDGRLTLSLETVIVDDPADDEIIVRVEAAPINPSDLGLLLGPADLSTLEETGGAGTPSLTFMVPQARLESVKTRLEHSMPVGNEGAGVVVAAGKNASELKGRLVGMIGGAMFAEHRKINRHDVVPLPSGASAADGASMFVNPLTALGFVETARREGHTAIVHTAAASNLGQMLQKICLIDEIPLVNIVRSEEQVQILSAIGAKYVLNSQAPNFMADLTLAIQDTGATIAFDAIGGGQLGSDVMRAMEHAAAERMTAYSRYGSDTFKHLYIYGSLDLTSTKLERQEFGFHWSVSGWLLFPFLQKSGSEVAERLRNRVLKELTTTFSSTYTKVISLSEALSPDILRLYQKKATGTKFLIDPTRG